MGENAKPDRRCRRLILCAFLLAAFTLFAGLGKLALMEPDEERNAEVAREMKESGAWLIPTYNGLPYHDKPAFFFKTVALSFSAFGQTAMAARLPSALFGLALLILLFAFCRRVYNDRCAALTILIVATAPLYVAFARLVIMDMMLAFFVCASIFAGFLAEEDESRRKRWYLVGAASSGLATLVKGPVGFLLPILVLCVLHVLDHRPAALKRMFAPQNLILFFLIVLPWFLGVTRSNPDFAYYGIIEESWHRYTTNSFHRGGPVYYYLPWILLGGFAWSLLLPESMIVAWKTRARWSRADRLFVIWAVALLVFFSVSKSKRPDYILTVMVALGALIGRVFDVSFAQRHEDVRRVIFRGTILLTMIAAVGAVLLATCAVHPALLGHLSHGEDRFLWLVPSCFPVACGLILTGVVAGGARWRRSAQAAFCAFLLLPLVLFTAGFRGACAYSESKSNLALARRVSELSGGADIVCLKCFPSGLPFHLKRCITVVTDAGKEFKSNYIIFMLQRTTTWPVGVVHSSERDAWLAAHSNRPAYLIANEREYDTLAAMAAQHHISVTELEAGWWGVRLPSE
jgi:4-amino-4-deoxy-L-arabinose transferase-like glycosyltransferase